MPENEKVDSLFFATEVLMTWLALSEEFGNTPEELARLEKCRERKGELVFDQLQKTLKIPAGSDPFTVVKTLGDYLTKIGFAKFEVQKVSDTELLRDWDGSIMRPILPIVRSLGNKVFPAPSSVIFNTALRKLCNMKAERVEVPEHLKAGVTKGLEREMLRLSPIKK
ncbi:MAG: hypothetical protein HYY41_02765 [Chloroflexi bacterium]|nr:hypothetical protein [Chloroflexota bacterium]MBI2979734.1 hypothetical protein [Chloroflexota bacterium]